MIGSTWTMSVGSLVSKPASCWSEVRVVLRCSIHFLIIFQFCPVLLRLWRGNELFFLLLLIWRVFRSNTSERHRWDHLLLSRPLLYQLSPLDQHLRRPGDHRSFSTVQFETAPSKLETLARVLCRCLPKCLGLLPFLPSLLANMLFKNLLATPG